MSTSEGCRKLRGERTQRPRIPEMVRGVRGQLPGLRMSTETIPTDPPFALAQALDRCAKHWWGLSLGSKILGFLIGACVGLLPAEPVPFLVAACAVIAELCLYRSDAIKGTAQLVR